MINAHLLFGGRERLNTQDSFMLHSRKIHTFGLRFDPEAQLSIALMRVVLFFSCSCELVVYVRIARNIIGEIEARYHYWVE